MRLPYQAPFTAQHRQQIGRRTRVVDRAVLRVLLGERLAFLADLGPIDRAREDQRVVSADVRIGLLARHQQKLAVGVPPAGLEVVVEVLHT